MKWEALLKLVRGESVFSSSLMMAGDESPEQIRLQLGRWVKSGRLIRLRRGIYAPAPAWQKISPHPFTLANALQRGSDMSLQPALEFHGLIPESEAVKRAGGANAPGR